jgi:hypothetical protein
MSREASATFVTPHFPLVRCCITELRNGMWQNAMEVWLGTWGKRLQNWRMITHCVHIVLTFEHSLFLNLYILFEVTMLILCTIIFRVYTPLVNFFAHIFPCLGAFAKFRRATISFIKSVGPSVRPSAWNNSAPTGRIFMKFDTLVLFGKLLTKFKFH